MLSSTSSSNSASNRDVVLLLALLLAFVLALEGAARFVMPRKSVGISRITRDLADTTNLGPISRDGRPTVLLVGNSLLLDGIDRGQLITLTKDAADVHMFPAEGTMYVDWKFGLRRLFYSGTRPSLIVLCVNAEQLTTRGTNGATFAHFMMPLRDYREVVRESDLHPMAASEYFLAHWSYWLATRGNVRMGIMERVIPGAKALVPHLTLSGKHNSDDAGRMTALIVDRLQTLQAEAARNGSKFVWLVPPTENSADLGPDAVVQATAAGVAVLIPYQPGEMPAANYADGFHLNAEGARLLTPKVASSLKALIQANSPLSEPAGSQGN